MLFVSVFKTLIGKQITVELKNDVIVTGILSSVDQYLNLKIKEVEVKNVEQYPYLAPLTDMFIRGQVVRYVTMAKQLIDPVRLEDASRREMANI